MISYIKGFGFKESTNDVDDLRDNQFALQSETKEDGGQLSTMGYSGVVHTSTYLLKVKQLNTTKLDNMVLGVQDLDGVYTLNYDAEKQENGYLITINTIKEY